MSRSPRRLIIALAATVAAWPAQSPARSTPAQLTVEGVVLPKRGEARRTALLGTVVLYQLGLFSTRGPDAESLAPASVAKAVRVEVEYEPAPERRVPRDWRHELIPPLAPDAVAHLRGSFAPLRRGDVVLVEYTPARGTFVRVNRAVAVSGAHHDLMLAFLDHWLGDRPVSEAIKRALLASP